MSTINEEYEHWFKNKEYMVRDSTLAAYDLMYRNHIKNDEIANMEIKNIRSRHLQDMIGRLHQTGLSTKSIKDIIVLVKMIMGWFLDGLDLYLPKFNLQYPREEGAMKELETYSPETPCWIHHGASVLRGNRHPDHNDDRTTDRGGLRAEMEER